MKKEIEKANRFIVWEQATYLSAKIFAATAGVTMIIRLTNLENEVAHLLFIILIALNAILLIISYAFTKLAEKHIEKIKEESRELKLKNKYKLLMSEEKEYYAKEDEIIAFDSKGEATLIKISPDERNELFE